MPSSGDGGLHVHLREDESMHLLERQLEVAIGEKAFDWSREGPISRTRRPGSTAAPMSRFAF